MFSKLRLASLCFMNNRLVSPQTLRYSASDLYTLGVHRQSKPRPTQITNPTCLFVSCLKLLPVDDFPSCSSIRKHIVFTSNPSTHPLRSISIKLWTIKVLLPTVSLETPTDWMITELRWLLLAVPTRPISHTLPHLLLPNVPSVPKWGDWHFQTIPHLAWCDGQFMPACSSVSILLEYHWAQTGPNHSALFKGLLQWRRIQHACWVWSQCPEIESYILILQFKPVHSSSV